MVENVVLTVHLILALLLIGVVLLQRSEGGGLGMGSGGGSGVMTGRQAANALSRLTWIFAVAFIITSLTLTIIAARNVSGSSITDQLDIGSREQGPTSGMPSLEDYTPPPGAGQPAVPGAGQPVPPPAAGDAAATTAPTAETPAAASAPATPPAAPAPAADSPAPASN
ncbi:preprotein translocase subunit SecG [Paracoccus halophilus]|uniref:preprotein translocase subunit SecG n=1 Tax=Paracoccus halophilus TaxID=376733 RepID=UPI000B2F1644|nr:preprotein translocase subunit SecG [Paracoccus halophilus]